MKRVGSLVEKCNGRKKLVVLRDALESKSLKIRTKKTKLMVTGWKKLFADCRLVCVIMQIKSNDEYV